MSKDFTISYKCWLRRMSGQKICTNPALIRILCNAVLRYGFFQNIKQEYLAIFFKKNEFPAFFWAAADYAYY